MEERTSVNSPSEPVASPLANPLLGDWTGPYGGVPPFDRVEVAHFEPALEAAMAEAEAEIEAIADDPAPPSFENTIAALEASGRTLDRVDAIYGVWSSSIASPAFQAVQRRMAPRLAAFADRITQNEALFRRIEAVHAGVGGDTLSAEQRRLTWRLYTNFVRAGAKLGPEAKSRLSEINQRLAALFTEFNQNVLGDENSHYLVLEREADVAGLPDVVREAAAAAAEERALPGKWVVANTRSSVEPFLTYSERRDLRERAWRMWVERGDSGGERDTKGIVAEILTLRAERARLLGYPTHAHWRVEDAMAKTPERALDLMDAVWRPAVERVAEEVADMEALAREAGDDTRIRPWDYRYWAEKVRLVRFDVDQNRVKEYLQLEKLREGMFWVAAQLFGLRFDAVHDVPAYHPDVRVWRVSESATGRLVGLWYFDPYARAGKRSGAWMTALRRQERFQGEVVTIVSNTANFVKGRPGEPVLISWDDASTLFHEFGHALHGLASDVTYPTLSGTSVPRDYVEFPSQLLEHWLYTPEVLQRFARHWKTGAPMPQELADRLDRSATFNQGFATVEFLGSGLVDMKIHLAEPPIDPAAFEREALAELGMPESIGMRHRIPHFQHAFGSDAYSAGYYSYLWADVLTADAFEAFTEAGGPYDTEVAGRLQEHVLSRGNTVEPEEGYRAFRGRGPRTDALMRKRGFPVPEDAGAL